MITETEYIGGYIIRYQTREKGKRDNDESNRQTKQNWNEPRNRKK